MSPASKSLLKIAFALGLVGVCLIPSLPMFFADQQRSKQAECRRNLEVVMTRFQALQDGGSPALSELAAAVPEPRRQPYTYVLGQGVIVEATKHAPSTEERQRQLAVVKALVEPGLRGACPDCQLTIACVGNTDSDEQLDLLSLSSGPRYVFGDLRVDPLESYLHSSDYGAEDPGRVVRYEAADAGRP